MHTHYQAHRKSCAILARGDGTADVSIRSEVYIDLYVDCKVGLHEVGWAWAVTQAVPLPARAALHTCRGSGTVSTAEGEGANP